MSRLRFRITMSLDGFAAGPKQSLDNPLGVRGEELHEWIVGLAAFSKLQGGPDEGEVNESTPIVESLFENIGATIMGRNMFGGGPGRWDAAWTGWWGDNPPYHHPVFVLTHHAREPVEMQGGTTFHFVTDGIESALERAKAAAGGKDVSLAGGAEAAQQYLRAGLIDEMLISIAPVLLGSGSRLFDDLGDLRLEQVEAVAAPGVVHVTYRPV